MDNLSVIYEKLDDDQRIEVKAGMKKGLDVSCYAQTEYLAIQMRQIRLGLEEGLDVSVYNRPDYDWFQMEEIRLGMLSNVAYELYAKPSVDYKRMRQIRKGLEAGIDLSMFIKLDAGLLTELRKALLAKINIVEYIKEGYVVEQLVEIRHALEKNIDIRPYISVEYRGASIREIRLGLEAGLPVFVYANLEYGWQQMREIRLGMEARVDVSQYRNSLFSWQQMRELRLGLEEGLDIEPYRKFLYTAADMEQMRKALLVDEVQDIVDDHAGKQVVGEAISIFVSKDEMEACIEIAGDNIENITEKTILDRLKQSGITQGILYEEVRALIEEKRFGQTIVIARGQAPQRGKDGWYEFFFETSPSRAPKILEDGTADFRDVKWFEMVEKNQKLAYYHSAEFGIAGFTVTGKFLKAKKGREKNVLRGKGFWVKDDGKTYISLLDGRITYDGESRLDISRVCVLGNVNLATGNIVFDGTVHVTGNVGSGVMISATENVIVDGYVEAAVIRSGGEIFLRQGVNGNGGGVIEAGEGVVGQFFEDVRVVSGKDIIGQYGLNCMLQAEGKVSFLGNKGLLLGGSTRAAGGIEAHSIGNKMGLQTVLNVGVDQETVKLQQKIMAEIESVEHEMSILQHSQKDFQKKYVPEVRNVMEIYLKIENAIYTKELQLKQLMEEKAQLEEKMKEMEGARITVTGVMYEGTEITMGNAKWKAFSVKDVVIRCVNNEILVESN